MTDVWQPINGIYRATAPLFPWLENLSIPTGTVLELAVELISAGFGALAGALMAGRIARNAKQRDELLTELRSIDGAVTLCGSIMDVLGAAQRQVFSPLFEEHRSQVEAYKKYQNDPQDQLFKLKITHRRIPAIQVPIAELSNIVMEQTSISKNGLRSMFALADAVANLNGMIDTYNSLIERMRRNDFPSGIDAEKFGYS